jgi:hypothetical protein
MGRVEAAFGLEAGRAGRAFAGLLQAAQGRAIPNPRPDGVDIGAVAEMADLGQFQIESRGDDLRQGLIEFGRHGLLHVADELQGDVKRLDRPPARALDPVLAGQQALADLGGTAMAVNRRIMSG